MCVPFAVLTIPLLTAQASTPKSATEIYAEVRESVVLIKGERKAGSGVMVSADGMVVTNYHVVAGEKEVWIKFASGPQLATDEVVAADPQSDLAVLKLKGQGFRAAQLADSDKTLPGESIVVISNPLGLEASVTNGLISGIRGAGQQQLFQISAPISPGSSGGPVFNSRGQVIAIARATAPDAQNVNFAVPSNIVRDLLGKIQTAKLSSLTAAEAIPAAPPAVIAKVMKYLENDMVEEAVTELTSAVRDDEFNPRLRLVLAAIQKQIGQLDSAIQQANIARKLDSSLWIASDLLAELHLRRAVKTGQTSDRSRACGFYSELLSSSDLSGDLGNLPEAKKRWQQALDTLSQPSGAWTASTGETYTVTKGQTGDYTLVPKNLTVKSFSANFQLLPPNRWEGKAREATNGICFVEESARIQFLNCASTMSVETVLQRVIGPTPDLVNVVGAKGAWQTCLQRRPGEATGVRYFTRVPSESDLWLLGISPH